MRHTKWQIKIELIEIQMNLNDGERFRGMKTAQYYYEYVWNRTSSVYVFNFEWKRTEITQIISRSRETSKRRKTTAKLFTRMRALPIQNGILTVDYK